MIPSSTEISYFLELYANRHLSNSAIRLGIAQPSLTVSLQRLERKVGVPLFIRTKRGLIPSAAGKQLYKNAQVLVEAWNGLSGEITDIAQQMKGRFRLGCHPAVGAYCLPPLLAGLNETAPAIELDVVHDFSRKITERLVAYELDLAYVINPVRHPDLVLVKVGEDRVTFWKRKGERALPKRLLADVNTDQIERLLGKRHRNDFKDWTSFQSSSLELIRTLTLDGQGVGILPERVARADSSSLVLFDEGLPVIRDEVYLAYRKETATSAAAKELIRLARVAL